jgi:ABC-type glycerol-3-phosphate transport system permease component
LAKLAMGMFIGLQDSLLSMVPLLLAFMFFSKQMMAGLTAGTVKG